MESRAVLPDFEDVADADGLKRAIEALGEAPSACPICAHTELARRFERADKWFWQCAGCELVFVHDIYPEFVEELDGEFYDSGLRRQPRKKERLDFERLLAEFEGARETGRLLEVGCGSGLFLDAAAAAGWSCAGIEPHAPFAAAVRERLGIEVLDRSLREDDFEPAAFDVVYMNEVIEHVVDPVKVMRRVRNLLRPGGLALLRTGNAGSWSARLRGRTWWYYWFCSHGHIRFYSPRTAQALATEAGFARAASSTRGFAFIDGDELRGHWSRPVLKLSQSLVSPLAAPAGAGHRLTMRFWR